METNHIYKVGLTEIDFVTFTEAEPQFEQETTQKKNTKGYFCENEDHERGFLLYIAPPPTPSIDSATQNIRTV